MAGINADQMRALLNPYYVRSNEFYDGFVMMPLMIAAFQGIHGLRSLYAMSSQTSTGSGVFLLTDTSGNGKHLSDNAEPALFQQSSIHVPYCNFNGTTERWIGTDERHWDITGGEAGIGSTQRGLTMGAWVYYDNTASASEYIMSKRQESDTQISYGLRRNASGYPVFQISSDGTDTGIVEATGTTVIPQGQWTFVVGRFDPSTEMAVFANGSEDVNTTSIPATIYVGTADFMMAARDDSGTPGQLPMDGRISMAFIAASYVADYDLLRLYEISRIVFGVD
jgi:hypothetical protein